MGRKNTHLVQREAAFIGNYRVKKIREQHKKLGWKVDHRRVNANGVDLVCYKKYTPDEPEAYEINNEYHEEIIKVFEITNWARTSWMGMDRFKRIAKNLIDEEKRQRELHPNAEILRMLVYSYEDNIKSIPLKAFVENEINLREMGFQSLPLDRKPVKSWVE